MSDDGDGASRFLFSRARSIILALSGAPRRALTCSAGLASGAGAPTPGAGGPSPFAANPFSATPTPGGGGGGGNGVYAGGSVLVPGSTTHAPFIPGMSAASAPALVRVVSLAVGMGANASVMQLPPDAAFFALPPGGAAGGPPVHAGASTLYAGSSIMGQAPGAAALAAGPGGGAGAGAGAGAGGGGPRHHRSTSRSTAFASTQGAAQLRDVAVMRDAAEAALAAQPGVCLSGTMCVIRSTLHKVSGRALVTPLLFGGAPRCTIRAFALALLWGVRR